MRHSISAPVTERDAIAALHSVRHILFVATIAIALAAPSTGRGAVPAFHGAQGGGAASVGGRGGAIIAVTNLNDSGPGSLRAALESSGPRIVVFRVAGTITLSSQLRILNPYITVAGQTAPGGGILIKGSGLNNSPLIIGTHDVVLRYLRIRAGKGTPAQQDAISAGEGRTVYNVVLDHISASWSNDENIAFWSDSGTLTDFTIQDSISSEGLNHDSHSTGLIVGSNAICTSIDNVTVVRNLFMSNRNRNPYVKINKSQIINNIVYNWQYLATQIAGGMTTDIIGNLYKAGPDSGTRSEVVCRLVSDWTDCNFGPPGNPSIYIAGNVGPHQSDPAGDQWNTMLELAGGTRENGWGWPGDPPKKTRLDPTFQRTTSLRSDTYPVTIDSVTNLEAHLLSTVGAAFRLDGKGNWVPNRDAVDTRLLRQYRTNTGLVPDDEVQAGGFPTLATGTAYADADGDGMPNDWEARFGFAPNSATDVNLDADNDGYTNIEEFLNGTHPRIAGALIGSAGLDSNSHPRSAPIDLTVEGIEDWVHWGLSNADTINRKAGVPAQISDWTRIGTSSVSRHGPLPEVSYSWTDGTPTGNFTAAPYGVRVLGVNNGFQFTVPASTQLQTLYLFVAVNHGGARLEVSLSDNSAPVQVYTGFQSPNGEATRLLRVAFRAASSGQTATFKYTLNSSAASGAGVTLAAALLR
ncbi:MAG TPA: hypothetical protein VER55_11320 [Ardenticatenaceae bacterium]|nr:hypothetical protein [Ardenticatenaceae bacterium]